MFNYWDRQAQCLTLCLKSVGIILCFLFYRMTEEEREKAQEQLKALNEAYTDLSDQTTSAEEVWELVSSLVSDCVSLCVPKQRHLMSGCMTNVSPLLLSIA